MKVEAPSSFLSPEEVWTSLFKSLCERIGPCFARSETRERVQAYLRGLLSPVERKNGWQLAEEAGFSTPYAMQYLLNRAVWESDQVRDQLQASVREMSGDADGIYVLDETGFLKKGKKSVGVQRQYSGTAGRVENCQIGVFLAYASQAGHTLVDRELYLPKSWTQDPERCREADVPEEVVFATKPQLAARMLWRALDAGLPAKWVTGDAVYGSHRPRHRRSGGTLPSVCALRQMYGEGRGPRRVPARGSHRRWAWGRPVATPLCRQREQGTAPL